MLAAVEILEPEQACVSQIAFKRRGAISKYSLKTLQPGQLASGQPGQLASGYTSESHQVKYLLVYSINTL